MTVLKPLAVSTPQSPDDAFEDAWQRLLLMLENTAQFNTLFVFSGNQVLELALQQRLHHTVMSQSLHWRFVPQWDESTTGQAHRFLLAAQWVATANVQLQAAHWVAEQIVKEILQSLFSPNSEDSVERNIFWFDLRSCLGRLVVAWLDALHDALIVDGNVVAKDSAVKDLGSAYDLACQHSQHLLLARLNERRGQLEKLGPLVIVLPLDQTKAASLYAPDLWTVRLSSLYLEGFSASADSSAQSLSQVLPQVERTHTSLSDAQLAVLQKWQQAFAQNATDHLLISDGWLAIDTARRLGQTDQALTVARQCLNLAYSRGSLREQMVSQAMLGDVLARAGDATTALGAYQIALKLSQNLAEIHADSAEAQRDLSVSFERVAGILEAQGEREKALLEYRKSLVIAEKLASSDPKNTDWKRDLSVSYERVAGILEAQGEREKALLEYRKSLVIREKLASSDPKNTDWQIDLVVSYWKLSGLAMPKDAAVLLEDALQILKRLDAAGALRADQKGWQAMMQARLDSLKQISSTAV